MADEAKRNDILQRLNDGVVNYDEEKVATAANEAVEVGLDPFDAIMNGLAAGMEIVGQLYEKQEYFVPEIRCVPMPFMQGSTSSVPISRLWK